MPFAYIRNLREWTFY